MPPIVIPKGVLVFRGAREADLDRLIEIHMSAFPDERGVEPRKRNFLDNALGGLEHLHVAEKDGRVVAHAFLFALGAFFGGRRVQAGGIASVGVAPEARGAGVGAAMLAWLHGQAEARGDAITWLYAFRQGFYARSGYAPVSPSHRIVFHPRAVPASWRASSGVVRPAAGSDREALERVYEKAGAVRTGWLARTPRVWERKLVDERRHWFVVERDGAVEGYVAWSLVQAEAHAPVHLVVEELVATDVEAERRLLSLVSSQRDQVTSVTMDLAADDPLDRALVDADQGRPGTERIEHPLGTLVGGPMVRLVDVARAIEARGYREDGELEIAVDDATPLHVAVNGGRAVVTASRGATPLRIDAAALAAVLYGSLRPSDAARLGWAHADAPLLRLADSILALPAFFALDPF